MAQSTGPFLETNSWDLYPPNKAFAEGTQPLSNLIYRHNVQLRPKGWEPVVLDTTALDRKLSSAKPHEMGLIRDAVARFTQAHPYASRLISRVEVIDDVAESGRGVFYPGENPRLVLNLARLREAISRYGPAAVDTTLAHEMTHAAQQYLGNKFDVSAPYSARPFEQSAFRRGFKTLGMDPDPVNPPLSLREQNRGPESWRTAPIQRMGAPKTPVDNLGTTDFGAVDAEYFVDKVRTGKNKGKYFVANTETAHKVSPRYFETEWDAIIWLNQNAGKLLLTRKGAAKPGL